MKSRNLSNAAFFSGAQGVSNLQQAVGLRAVLAGHKLTRVILLIEIPNRHIILTLGHDSNN